MLQITMSTLSNETVQMWIKQVDYPQATLQAKRVVELGTELLATRRDLAAIAKALDDLGTSLDELKELL